jgi:hypothetical protein
MTNELMRHLLVDIPQDDQRHLVEVVDRNHANQLRRKRKSHRATDTEPVSDDVGDGYDDGYDAGDGDDTNDEIYPQ